MTINAAQLCELLQGELVGDGGREVSGPSQIDAGSPGTVTFLANPKYEEFAYTTEADIIIVPKDFSPRTSIRPSLIKVDDVYGAMATLLIQFGSNGVPSPGISALAVVSEDAKTGEDVSIGAYSIIEHHVSINSGTVIYPQVFIGHDCTIGKDVIIYPGVKIYPKTVVGDRCILHANAVLGCDGFGYKTDVNGHYIKLPHIGRVVLEEDVEIGANTVIDRGTMAVTRIKSGVKIDNLVQIAHNVTIGEHTVMAAQSGIAGSSSVGKHSRIGGQVGISGHIHLPDRINIQAQSGIQSGNYEEGAQIFGYPAIPHLAYLRSYALFKQLPEYADRIKALEKELTELKKLLRK